MMEERSQLELRQLAERCKASIEQIEELLRGAVQEYDGPTLLDITLRIEVTYREFSEVFDVATTEPKDRLLALTRERFLPAAFEQNRALSQRDYVNLRSAVQHASRANEALGRCIIGIRDGSGFDNIKQEFEVAYNQIADTLHYSYLIPLPENGQTARHLAF